MRVKLAVGERLAPEDTQAASQSQKLSLLHTFPLSMESIHHRQVYHFDGLPTA